MIADFLELSRRSAIINHQSAIIMSEHWRILIYPLGFLSSLAFMGRFIIQWVKSEIRQKSLVTRSFWQLSLLGNVLLMLHAFFQIQFHVCVVQACNAVISWRNLNLMGSPLRQVRFVTVLFFLFCAVGVTIVAFALQSMLCFSGEMLWMQSPATPWSQNPPSDVSFLGHLVGFLGIALFSSRFWVQWWGAEKQQTSYLGPAFWWLSLVGALLSIVYFAMIQDVVNLIGPLLGLVPYGRNLILWNRAYRSTTPP